MKIGIIICDRYGNCGGGKCFRALARREGGFARYSAGEAVEVVGYSTCGGCPGGNVEHVPGEFVKNGAEAVHLATGLVVGYPPCPRIEQFRDYIETQFGLPVVIGTHPIPLKYMQAHERLPFWRAAGMERVAGPLLHESRAIMEAYD
jgi:predicted metal-binding protein